MRRQWSDQQKAETLAALDANGGDVRNTARQTGVPYTTLREWVAGKVTEGVTEIRSGKREALADRLEALAHAIVDALPGKMDAASMRDMTVSFGIAIDKMRLLREQPTNIERTDDLSDGERVDRLAALAERARTRRDGSTAPVREAVN